MVLGRGTQDALTVCAASESIQCEADVRHVLSYSALILSALLSQPGLTGQQTPHHEFTVSARRYAFDPPRLEVHSGDLVKVTLRSQDIPHSFVVDAYRIARRVEAGGNVTFEFLADRAGTFPFYCSLTAEEGCRDMKGEIVVLP